MTTTDPAVDPVDTNAVEGEPPDPELCWLNLGDLAPHPDNPRRHLGNLTELVRSIRSHGILEPLVVLPADDDGVYRIVAGHRRHAAGIEASVTDVPAVVRPMNPSEVIDAMLSENVNRSDLTVSEEVRAIERRMSLDEGLTPAKLCRRIGRSQAWVRARMAVTILPARRVSPSSSRRPAMPACGPAPSPIFSTAGWPTRRRRGRHRPCARRAASSSITSNHTSVISR
jgi:ParB/RepB/Spo0J family partition protein